MKKAVTCGYDGKNRLTAWNVKTFLQPLPVPDGPRSQPLLCVDSTFTMTYDETTGNIIAKSDLGADAVLGYGETTAPHALDLVSGVATDWGTDAVAIGYTDFGKVSSITEGDWTYTIAYSPDGVRAKSNLSDGQGGYTMRHYGDRTEKTRSNGNNLDYLSYLCHGAIVVHHGTGRSPLPPTPTAILQGYYDAQGSLIALVDANGFVVQRYAYDPWGRRVDPEDWTQDDTTQADVYHINRGYTMHEHLREFGLINMNGRVFDPAVAQFLSPDNYIQAEGNWLNYNRYAYCLNNPLKYTDPSGDFFFVIPNIGWNKEGGFNIGASVVFGVPGGLSVQAGIGYSFGAKDFYGYVGATLAMNTLYASFSLKSGASIGYTAGLSLFSGLPVSTNFGTVGFNYNFSNKSLSGNISAWQIDENGWTFNPSISAMIFPEQTTNLARGQGFKNNDDVLNQFVQNGDYQGALDYFGFEGKYNPNIKASYQESDYWGATNLETGEISYGNLAFENYSVLYETYIKESYHSQKIRRGIPTKKMPTELQGIGMDNFLEEISGYIYAYKRQGLFYRHLKGIPYNGIKYYQTHLDYFNVAYPTYPNRFSWIYKTPRLW